jgi:hypothetical protein
MVSFAPIITKLAHLLQLIAAKSVNVFVKHDKLIHVLKRNVSLIRIFMKFTRLDDVFFKNLHIEFHENVTKSLFVFTRS